MTAVQVQELVARLQALTFQMQSLVEVSHTPQVQFPVRELLDDIQDWHRAVQRTFQRLSKDPAAGNQEVFQTRMFELLAHLEVRLKKTLETPGEEQISIRDGENFYLLLGVYRGVSEALVDYVGSTDVIDWSLWREERF